MADEQFEGPEDFDTPPSFFPYDDVEESDNQDFVPGEPVECRVEAVYGAQTDNSVQHYVLLTDGMRKLPILIGRFEAQSITFAVDGQQPDRPLTHDILRTTVEKLGASVEKILIDDLWGSTYYAKVFLKQKGKEIIIDSRPSDAIALAVRTDAPIFIVEGILNQHTRFS